jgi:hypothetical protein
MATSVSGAPVVALAGVAFVVMDGWAGGGGQSLTGT